MRFKAFWERSLDAYLEDLRTLVNMDSGSLDIAAVDACIRTFAGMLEERLAMEVTYLPDANYGPTALAKRRGSGKGRILLVGHLDTVFERGEAARRPFSIKEGRALGPGVVDMKGGVALGLYSLSALFESGFDNFEEIAFIVNPDEEVGSPSSSSHIVSAAKGGDAVLVLEAGRPEGGIVTARKGVGSFTLTARGSAAHAGVAPEHGRSAIVELANKIIFLEQQQHLSPGLHFNVGRIRGGSRANVVPAEASMEVDVRVKDAREVLLAQDILRKCASHTTVQGVHLELTGSFEMPPMECTAASRALLAIADEAAKEEGFPLRAVAAGGGSDGNRVSEAGLPVLDGLGPVGGHSHRDDEFIELSSVPERGSFLATLIEHVAHSAH